MNEGTERDLGDLKIWGKDGLRFCVIKGSSGLKEVHRKSPQATPRLLRMERPLRHGGLGLWEYLANSTHHCHGD